MTLVVSCLGRCRVGTKTATSQRRLQQQHRHKHRQWQIIHYGYFVLVCLALQFSCPCPPVVHCSDISKPTTTGVADQAGSIGNDGIGIPKAPVGSSNPPERQDGTSAASSSTATAAASGTGAAAATPAINDDEYLIGVGIADITGPAADINLVSLFRLLANAALK